MGKVNARALVKSICGRSKLSWNDLIALLPITQNQSHKISQEVVVDRTKVISHSYVIR